MSAAPAWARCAHCGEWACRIHRMHTHECPCPAIEEWTVDPYTAGGPPRRRDEERRGFLFGPAIAALEGSRAAQGGTLVKGDKRKAGKARGFELTAAEREHIAEVWLRWGRHHTEGGRETELRTDASRAQMAIDLGFLLGLAVRLAPPSPAKFQAPAGAK